MKEILKLALEALDTCMYPQPKQIEAIAALRLAIDAQNMSSAQVAVNPQYVAFMDVPFKRWVELTEDDAIELLPVGDWDVEPTLEFFQAVQQALKEKNNG